MTREEAIEILISVAVCDRPILSCDFCARYAGIGTHCNYPTDEEIEEAVLLLKGASKDMAISSLRQQEHFREVTKKVEPLTLEEMRDMPCEPVYIVVGCVSWWDIVSYAGMEYLYLKVEGSLPFIDYGKNWTAYRQKPEEEDDHDERKENENV